MYFVLNLSHYVKSYGHLCQFLACFIMPALQIWPCHVTQKANFEKILLFPKSAFNSRKSYKISSRKARYFRSYQPETSRGVERSPECKGNHSLTSRCRLRKYKIYELRNASLSSNLEVETQPVSVVFLFPLFLADLDKKYRNG